MLPHTRCQRAALRRLSAEAGESHHPGERNAPESAWPPAQGAGGGDRCRACGRRRLGLGVFFTPDSPIQLRLSTQAGDTAFAVPVGVWSVGRGSVAGYRVREKLLRLPASNDAVRPYERHHGCLPPPGRRERAPGGKGMRSTSTSRSQERRGAPRRPPAHYGPGNRPPPLPPASSRRPISCSQPTSSPVAVPP